MLRITLAVALATLLTACCSTQKPHTNYTTPAASPQAMAVPAVAPSASNHTVAQELKLKQAELKILQQLEAKGKASMVLSLEGNSCTSPENCCCVAGTYGACTTPQACTNDIGGQCASSAPGC